MGPAVPAETGQCVPLANGHVLGALYDTDGFAERGWYLELEPLDAGFVPAAVLYQDSCCVDLNWDGEGELAGTVSVDARSEPVRCRLDLRTQRGDATASFLLDTQSDSRELREYLSYGLAESLGLRFR